MRIAHVIRALDVGGAERVTAELASIFAQQGHEVTIFVGWPTSCESPAQQRLDPAVRVEYIQQAPASRIATYLFAVWWTWRNRRRLLSFDVFHCHLAYGALIATVLGSWGHFKRPRALMVETYHSVGARIPRPTRWAHSWMAARRDVLVLMASDSYWSRFVRKHPALAVRTVLNGVPAPQLQSLTDEDRREYRARVGIPEEARFVVGSIGMLRPDRQPSIFLPVIVGLVDQFGDDIHWLFAGDGPEREKLQRLVGDAGVARNVHFVGLVTDIRYPLSVLDLHFTAAVEGVIGIAGIEGALAGVPVLAFQASPDYETRAEDWVWSSNQHQSIVATAVTLLRDSGKRHELAQRQKEYAARHHSLECMAAAYRDIYQMCAAIKSVS